MKLVILDRDGVINRDSDDYIKSASEFDILPGSIEAITHLHKCGFTVVVATNQSGLGRGLFDLDDLEAMHQKLKRTVEAAGGEVSGIFYCPHTPADQCKCRKPLPGLLDAIESEYATSLKGFPLVGDSLRDLQAGAAKGCDPILVKTGKGLKTLEQLNAQQPFKTHVCQDLLEAAHYITQKY
jgi:D-glycero-D-manno-heptose 1,7-bisphosphate phosphatase